MVDSKFDIAVYTIGSYVHRTMKLLFCAVSILLWPIIALMTWMSGKWWDPIHFTWRHWRGGEACSWYDHDDWAVSASTFCSFIILVIPVVIVHLLVINWLWTIIISTALAITVFLLYCWIKYLG